MVEHYYIIGWVKADCGVLPEVKEQLQEEAKIVLQCCDFCVSVFVSFIVPTCVSCVGHFLGQITTLYHNVDSESIRSVAKGLVVLFIYLNRWPYGHNKQSLYLCCA